MIKKIFSLLLICMLLVNVFGTTVFAQSQTNDKDDKWEKIMTEYYGNYISNDQVDKYYEELEKAKTPWELKKAREKFFKENNIKLKLVNLIS